MRLAAQGPSASRAAAAASWDPKYANFVFPDGNATLDTRSSAPQSRSSRGLDLSLHFLTVIAGSRWLGRTEGRGGAPEYYYHVLSQIFRPPFIHSTISSPIHSLLYSLFLCHASQHKVYMSRRTVPAALVHIPSPLRTIPVSPLHRRRTVPAPFIHILSRLPWNIPAPASAPRALRRRRARPRPLYANRELRAQTQAPTAAAEALRHDESDDINALPHRRRSCHTCLLFLLFAFCPLPAYFCQPRSSHRQKLRHRIALRCAETGRGRKGRITSVVIGLAGAGGFLPLSVLDLCASYLRGAVTGIFTCSAFSVFCLRPVHPGRAYDAASRAKFAHLEIASPTPAAVHDSKTLARFCSSLYVPITSLGGRLARKCIH